MNALGLARGKRGDAPRARAHPPGQPDLFDVYPDVPGARPADTSIAAAESIADGATRLRERVLDAIRDAGAIGLTPDEAAVHLQLTPFTTRPRFSELARMGLIKDSGFRRANASGRKAIVWWMADTPDRENNR